VIKTKTACPGLSDRETKKTKLHGKNQKTCPRKKDKKKPEESKRVGSQKDSQKGKDLDENPKKEG